jgi:RNA polymerase sigma factor (sigma-70 family)
LIHITRPEPPQVPSILICAQPDVFFRSHLRKDLKDLDSLIRRLPFDLDDGEAVGQLYGEWVQHGRAQAGYLVDLWTYCYVRRYFLIKFMRSDAAYTGADLEMVVERSFLRIAAKRDTIREQHKYANWVIVVCRNTYLNYVSRQPDFLPLDRVAEPGAEDEMLVELHDDAMRATALEAAIARLPAHLREIAWMKLVDGLEYEDIEQRTGITVPSARAYVHKALTRLRNDARFLTILGYEAGESGSKRHR